MQPTSSIWKNRTFAKMYAAYSVSTFGNWFDMIAVSVLFVYIWQADPLMIALIPMTFAVPGFLLGQFAGVLADRWKKLNIMIAADFIRAILTVVLLYMPSPEWALVVLTLRGVAGIFNMPAQQSLTRNVIAEEHLMKATSLNSLVDQMSKVLGPLIGGSLLTVFTPKLCLYINAISFLLSGILLLTVGKIVENQSLAERQGKKKPKFSESFKEGWATLLKNRTLLYSILFTLWGGLAIQLVDFQFGVPFHQYAPDKPNYFGWCTAAIGLGSVVIIFYLKRKKDIRKYGWYFGFGTILLSAMFVCMGHLFPGLPLYVPLMAMFISGIGNGINGVVGSFMMQKEAGRETMGRISGIMNTVQSGIMLVSPLLGGLLLDVFGTYPTFSYIGYFLFFWGIMALVLRNVIWGRSKALVTTPTAENEAAI